MTKEKEFLENHEAQSSPVDSFVASVVGESYNPDVLSCLANLSNDEVFTPPNVANQLLDALPQELFRSPDTTFLDPVCKTGVFLREIAKRLILGLQDAIPDLRERLDHIYKKQLFGIAITELTSLVSRRTLYCSMCADSPYSIVRFPNPEGNIRFQTTKHTWVNGKCSVCGASEAEFGDKARRENKENHAYEFIHSEKPEEIFNVKFDVIVGNPPYQMNDGGAFASASPLYHKFVELAINQSPQYVSMIIPSRWFAGGKGLDEFRDRILNDDRIRELHDYPQGKDCFPGIRIAGGVCYFLWTRETHGNCKVYSHESNKITSMMERPLLEERADTFIRYNEAIPILRKVISHNETSFSTIISSLKPFGLRSDFFADPGKYKLPNVSEKPIKNGFTIIGTYKYKTTKRYVPNDYPFPSGRQYIGKWKVFVSQVLDNGFDWTKERLRPFLGSPNDVCTETFLCVGSYDTKEEAENVISYMNTNLFHLLMHLKKVSHHVVAKVYGFVPLQDFSESWTNEKLYKKYNLTSEEIAFIEANIRPMD